jgi:hypothetical protein
MSYCDIHNQERKWIYSIGIESAKPLIIKEGATINSKYECIKCNRILMKALGYEVEKKHGRRRSRKN